MSEGIDPKITKIEDAILKLLFRPLVQLGVNAAFVKWPFLNTWPLRFFVRYFIEKYSEAWFEDARTEFDLSQIKPRNEKSKADYDKEVLNLKIIAREKGITSDEFEKARLVAESKFAKFVRYNGV